MRKCSLWIILLSNLLMDFNCSPANCKLCFTFRCISPGRRVGGVRILHRFNFYPLFIYLQHCVLHNLYEYIVIQMHAFRWTMNFTLFDSYPPSRTSKIITFSCSLKLGSHYSGRNISSLMLVHIKSSKSSSPYTHLQLSNSNYKYLLRIRFVNIHIFNLSRFRCPFNFMLSAMSIFEIKTVKAAT